MKYPVPIVRIAHFFTFSIFIFAISSTAFGAGFQISEQSGTGMGRAFAGFGVIGDDLSMAFYNPAGITMQEGTQLQLTGFVIDGKSRFSNQVGSSFQSFAGGALIIQNTGTNDDGATTSFVPNLYFVMDLSEKLKYGFSITAPYGLSTDYDRDWVGRFHAKESELITVNINPSLGYKINDSFSVGFGVVAQYADATLSQASSNGPGAPDGFAEAEGDDWGYGWNVGVMYHPSPTFRAGIGYRSKIGHELKGNTDIVGVPAVGGTFRGSVSARAVLPETIHAGIYKEITSKWGVSVGYRWTRWNRFEELRVRTAGLPTPSVTEEDWDNSYSANIGVDYYYSDKWTFRAGYMFDETPVPDRTRTPRIPDEDRHWVAIGASFKANDQLQLDFGFTHLFIDDADVNVTIPIAGGLGTDTLVGEYEDPKVNILSIQAVYQF